MMKLRSATKRDVDKAQEFRRALRGWSQDNMFLALAILHNDWSDLQGVVARQREQLRGAPPAGTKPKDRLADKVLRMATDTASASDVLAQVRSKHKP